MPMATKFCKDGDLPQDAPLHKVTQSGLARSLGKRKPLYL